MDIAAWLHGIGLQQYEPTFRVNDIDTDLLSELTDADLERLGVVSLGHRKKMLKSIQALQAAPTEPTIAAPFRTDLLSPGASLAERRQLTVMFCDLVGSTNLASRLDPEDLRNVIGGYQRCVAETIARYEGFVAKYMGDGILVYFGYPKAHEDDAERAIRAGLELPGTVSRLTTDDGTSLSIRIGIATGQVVVGDRIGEGAAQEQAVIGDTPNLAARLQGLAGPNEVIIGPATQRLVGGLFNLLDLEQRELKGFADRVQAWRVLGDSRAESRFAARRGVLGLTPLIGREHELGMLLDRFQQAKDGEGQVVLLSGEPGIGKSRLAHALLDRLSNEPHTRLRYYCSPFHMNSALYPIIEQLERAAGFESDDPPEAKLEKLEALLSRATKTLADIAPLFAALLSIPGGTRYSPLGMPAQRQRELTIVALLDQLVGLAAQEPVVLILEDSQWLDPTSTELFERAIERAQTLPILLLITYRPEFAPHWTSLPHITALTLNRLGRRQSTEMIAVVGGKPLPEAILTEIWAKTGGVPLFVEELTKNVLEAGLLEDKGDHYELTRPLPPLAIPSTLQDSLMARLDRFAPVKEVAQIAAVIGREISYRLLAALSPLSEREVQEALSQLTGSELMFRRGTIPDATYSFKHAFVQDAAYGSLLKSKRQQLHARVAETLGESFPEVSHSQPEILAHHLTQAGLTEQAIGEWQRAGELAAERSANAEAAAHLRRALELLQTLPESPTRTAQELDLLIVVGSLVIITKGHGHPEVLSLYGRARDLCRLAGDTSHLVAVLQGLRLYYMVTADLPSAYDAAQDLLALGEGTGDSGSLVEGHRAVGVASFFGADFNAARKHLERGFSLYESEAHGRHDLSYIEDDPGQTCLAYLAQVLWVLGYPDQALERSDQAILVATATADAPSLGEAMIWRAEIALFRGEVHDTRERAAAVLALANEHGLPVWAGLANIMHGWALSEQDQGADGVAQIRDGLSLLLKTGHQLFRLHFTAMLVDALVKTGQAEEALTAISEAIESSQRARVHYWESELQRRRGELLLVSTHAQEAAAETCLRRAVEIAQAQTARSLELRAATSLARLLAKRGERQQANDLLVPIYGWFKEGFETRNLKEARAVLDSLNPDGAARVWAAWG